MPGQATHVSIPQPKSLVLVPYAFAGLTALGGWAVRQEWGRAGEREEGRKRGGNEGESSLPRSTL